MCVCVCVWVCVCERERERERATPAKNVKNVCTVEPLYSGHHWGKTVLSLSRVATYQGFLFLCKLSLNSAQ